MNFQLRIACLSLVLLAAWPGSLAAQQAAPGESHDARFLAGLRERRLFELAEAYCTRELAKAGLSDERRTELALELSRSLSEHALYANAAERDALWAKAVGVCDAELAAHADSPRAVLVHVQGALALLSQGELLRLESEIAAGTEQETRRERARTPLRTAIRRLGEAAATTATQLRQTSTTGRRDKSRLAEWELSSLEKNIVFQLARAHRNLSLCYDAGSVDQLNQLQLAIERFESLTRYPADDPVHWPSQLEAATGRRLLKDFAGAERRLELIDEAKPSTELLLRARAERIRLALAQDDVEGALRLASAPRAADVPASPELELAMVETLLAAARRAEKANDPAAKAWQERVTTQADAISQAFGPYWARRADLLVSGHVAGGQATGNVALLVRAAENHVLAGRFDDALATYDRAASQAADPKQQFDLAFTAAAIEHKRATDLNEPRHAQASERFRALALAHPQNARAAQAHKLAVFHAAHRSDVPREQALAGYRALLEEHLARFLQAETGEVRLWLARLLASQREYAPAVQTLEAVKADSAMRDEALKELSATYQAWQRDARAAGQDVGPIVEAFKASLWNAVTDGERRFPQVWSPAQRAAAVELARLLVEEGGNGFRSAEQLLGAALAAGEDADAEWKATAQALLVVALAGQGRGEEANAMFARVTDVDQAAQVNLLDALRRIADAASPESRRNLAELRLQATARLNQDRDRLTADEKRSLDLARAAATRDAGRAEEARRLFLQVVKAYPRDATALEESGLGLVEIGDRESLEAARGIWRRLVQQSRPKSALWFRATYELAHTHERLGARDDALALIRVTRLLHPDLGGAEQKAQFEAMEARLRK